jgi:2-dehydro-3-deoxyphosphogluconate aldolase/(4S)-4-hydroxy-2-oxoglutarate aldolase
VNQQMQIEQRLAAAPVVPLVQSEHPEEALNITRALAAGGLGVIEVVLRTEAAVECLRHVAANAGDAIVGAGTVLTAAQAEAVVAAGAKFIVSPGLDDGVVAVAQAHGLPVYPGCATPSEVQHAWNLGLRAVKFFPASLVGGVPMLKALGSVFRGMRFMPTGGVSAANLGDFLAVPAVLACGGSWLTPAAEIKAGNFAAVTALAAEALALAKQARPG